MMLIEGDFPAAPHQGREPPLLQGAKLVAAQTRRTGEE